MAFEDLKIWRMYDRKLKNNDVYFDEKCILDVPKQRPKVFLNDFRKKKRCFGVYGREIRERMMVFPARKV